MLSGSIIYCVLSNGNFSVLPSGKEKLRVKIRLYYESKLPGDITVLDVPDYECEQMVEQDFQIRLSQASDTTGIERRSIQEILDEEFNKPTFNNNQTETRRHVSLDALDPEDKYITDETDLTEKLCLPDRDCLHRALRHLTPAQQQLVNRVFYEGYSQREIAAREGVDETAISKRMTRIYDRLRDVLLKENKFEF